MIDVLMDLDEDASFLEPELDGFVEDGDGGSDRNDGIELEDIFRIKADASVRYQPSDGPGKVGSVDPVAADGEAQPMGTERIVRTRRN